MFITNDHLDITAYEVRQLRPAVLLPRGEQEVWLVRETPLETDLAAPWSMVHTEAKLRVPLFPYLIPDGEPASAIAMGSRLGARFLWEAQQVLGQGVLPLRLHLSVGHPVQEVGASLRFWVGFALQVHSAG